VQRIAAGGDLSMQSGLLLARAHLRGARSISRHLLALRSPARESSLRFSSAFVFNIFFLLQAKRGPPVAKMGEILPTRTTFPSETSSFPFLFDGSEKFNRLGFLTVEPSFAAGY
jgi:hypothetical protein